MVNGFRPEYHPYSTHYELEDLPTAWGGYDKMPLRAKYFANGKILKRTGSARPFESYAGTPQDL